MLRTSRDCIARARTRALRLGFALASYAASLPASIVKADAAYGSTWATEASEGISMQRESSELAAMRAYEEELFGLSPGQAPEELSPDCVYGTPDALTDQAPPPTAEREGRSIDLSFLREAKLPSLPIHWDSRVIDYLVFFKEDRRGRDLISAWLKRTERYGPMIRRVLAEHSLPVDLQFVAMIESGYDPLARSPANALGLWQFVEQAGRYYGLRIDHWVDERLDPEASTHAAARYISDLYERFGGFELAFAAYNMGYSGLLRAMRKYNTNDYWLLSHLEAGLPFETSLYVAKITAAAIAANNPEKLGFANLTPEPPIATAKIEVPPGTNLGAIASAAGLQKDALKQLNPHLLRGRVPPGEGSVNVYLPAASEERFKIAWSKRRDPPQYVSYAVRFGEDVDDVARRFGVSLAKLREINDLAEQDRVGPGFALLVPATSASKVEAALPVATVPDRTFSLEGRKRIFYQAGNQDTVESVAKFFAVTRDELLEWNNLTAGALLQKGMLLQLFVRDELDLGRAVVFSPDEVRILPLGSQEFFDFHETQRGRVRVRYRVQEGETLAKLGERFELSAGSIGRINQFATDHTLAAGEWIVIYVPEKGVAELERKGRIERLDARGQGKDLAVETRGSAGEPGTDAQADAARAPETENLEDPFAPSEAEGERAPDKTDEAL